MNLELIEICDDIELVELMLQQFRLIEDEDELDDLEITQNLDVRLDDLEYVIISLEIVYVMQVDEIDELDILILQYVDEVENDEQLLVVQLDEVDELDDDDQLLLDIQQTEVIE